MDNGALRGLICSFRRHSNPCHVDMGTDGGRKGDNSLIRMVDGNQADAEDFFHTLRGDNPVGDLPGKGGKKKGLRAKTEEWGHITYRPESSDKGQPKGTIAPPTVAAYENGKQIKVKFK